MPASIKLIHHTHNLFNNIIFLRPLPPVGGGLCFLCANNSNKILKLTLYESLSICTLECSLPLFNKGWMRQHQGIGRCRY